MSAPEGRDSGGMHRRSNAAGLCQRAANWRLPDGPSPEVVSGAGAIRSLGPMARSMGLERALVTSDPGIVAAGIAERAISSLEAAGVAARLFGDFGENPTESDAGRAMEAARAFGADALVGVGGGSSLDVAKAAGFLLAGGGRMEDYRGYDRCPEPLPPLLGVPTTAGTGSEAQSYALISRDRDHQKLACGSPSAMFRGVCLDPELLPSAPASVVAATGFDAVAHAVETAASTRSDESSRRLSREAFGLLASAFPDVLSGSADAAAWSAMQRGAFLAGAAIERSMLGAAHALANPLTKRHGVVHGRALAVTLPRVVRWNAAAADDAYVSLLEAAEIRPEGQSPGARLAALLRGWTRAAGLPGDLPSAGVAGPDLPALAGEAAEEWTGRFNPRPFEAEAALELYRACA